MLQHYLKLFVAVILFLSVTFGVTGQNNHTSCTANRYISSLYPNVSSFKNVQFGNNNTTGGESLNLYMDIYEPTGDTASLRPLIILAHGGSFVNGHRSDVSDLCTFYAMRGFVAATIDYRLYDGAFPPSDGLATGLDQMYKGVSDMKAAIRYFREEASNGNPYKVDPQHIYIGGVSAGAIIANHVGYLDSEDAIPELVLDIITNNGGFTGNSSDNNEYSSEVNGIINFSGAILDATLMDNSGPPIFSVHEVNDPIVPFNRGFLSFSGFDVLEADGSNLMHIRASNLSITNQLHSIDSNEHVGYLDSPSSKEEVLELSTIFLNELLCNKTLNTSGPSPSTPLKLIPNPSHNKLKIYDALDRIFNLHLYHINGNKLLTHQNFKTNLTTINLNLPPGIYIISLENENTSKTLKLVKQ